MDDQFFTTNNIIGRAPKPAGWCEENGVEHAWVSGPTLTCDPPILTRSCANCGKYQRLEPSQWRDK